MIGQTNEIYEITIKQYKFQNGTWYIGDCLEILPQLPDTFVDVVITSPPYNVGKEYDVWNDNMSVDEYKDFIFNVSKELYRVVVKGGRYCINVPLVGNSWFNKKSDGLMFYPLFYVDIVEKVGWRFRDFVIWVKTNEPEKPNSFCGSSTRWGSWMSPSSPYLRCFAEVIFIFDKEDRILPQKGRATITRDEFLTYTKNVWYFPSEAKRHGHPAVFPVELPKRLIKLYSWSESVILDPFAGIGTTAVACEIEQRKWICIEISKKYSEIAFKRLDKLNTLEKFLGNGKCCNG